MTAIDRTVVSNKCDLKMSKIEAGSSGWRTFVRELGKDMPEIADTVTWFTYSKQRELAKMPSDWHQASTIGRFADDPSNHAEAQKLLENIFTVYTSYVESRTPRLLEQEHMSTMRWLYAVLQTAGEDNLAEILISFIADMKYIEE